VNDNHPSAADNEISCFKQITGFSYLVGRKTLKKINQPDKKIEFIPVVHESNLTAKTCFIFSRWILLEIAIED